MSSHKCKRNLEMTDETQTSDAQDSTNASADEQSQVTTDTQAEDNADASAEDQSSDTAENTDADAGAEKGEADDGEGEDGGEGVPEQYEAFNLPEGMELDESALADADPLFKELGLTQAQAQKAIDVYASIIQKQSDGRIEAYEAAQKESQKAIIEHPEYGGDKLDESMSVVGKLFDEVFGPMPEAPKSGDEKSLAAYAENPQVKFRQALDASGMANSPELFELFVKVGGLVGEDTFVRGGNASSDKRDLAEILYGKT